MRSFTTRAPLLAMLVGAAVALAPRAGAQSATDPYSNERVETRRALALSLARMTILRLRAMQEPQSRELRMVALSIDVAGRLDPTNIDLARRRIEAWSLAGDQGRVIDATRDLLKLDPSDTVSQLRLISSRINAVQEAEGRLAIYDRMLGPGGASLDESIRSRLALDAALLLRERGDERGFLERLTLSTQLDTSNKDAAVLAATHVLERSDDPLSRVEMLLNVIMADPIDASSHLNLARELRAHGAYRAAARFQGLGLQLHTRTGNQLTPEMRQETLIGDWLLEGPERILNTIDQIETGQREMRMMEIAYARQQGQDPGPPIEEFRLDPDIELLRLAVTLSLGRTEAVATSVRSIMLSTRAALDYLNDPPPELFARGVTKEGIESTMNNLILRLVYVLLWSGNETNIAQTLLEDLISRGKLREGAAQRFRGWVAIRRGDYAEARRMLEPLTDVDPQALLGLGVLAELEGRTDDAVRTFAVVALRQGGLMTGAFARGRIETLLGAPLNLTETAAALERYIARTPTWLDEMASNPRSYMALSAAPVPEQSTPVDGLFLRVTIRNIGRVPLAVGRGKPIESRILAAPQLSLEGAAYEGYMQPEVIEMNQRIRLRPGESMESVVWVGSGTVGILIDSVANRSLTARWRLIQGFHYDEQRRFVPSPLCITADSTLMTRTSIRSIGDSAGSIAQALHTVQGATLVNAVFHARGLILAAQQATEEQRGQALAEALIIFRAVAERMRTMSPAEKSLALLLVGITNPDPDNPIDHAMLENPSPLAMLTLLIARAPLPTHPAFTYAIAGDDPSISEMARLLRDAVVELIPIDQLEQLGIPELK